MALASDQPVSISGPAAVNPGVHSTTARHEHESSGQNARIADNLRQAADILAAQRADPFRIAAYRKAAGSVRLLSDDLGGIAERGGRDALEAVPGIGPVLAHRLCETLRLDAIEALEAAAYDGRLEQVRGFGRRRAAMLGPHLPRCSRASAVARSAGTTNPGGPVIGCRRRIPGKRDSWAADQDCTEALQSKRRGLAARAPHRARHVAFHRALLKYGADPPAGTRTIGS